MRGFFLKGSTFPKVKKYDVIIVGGGLAGLTVAIDLSRFGCAIAVYESNTYPHHKVCGEYVSKEVEPYLNGLGIDLITSGAVEISNFEMSTVDGRKVATTLPLGGLGISRYTFDDILYKKAVSQGVVFHFHKVKDISFENDLFQVESYGGESCAGKVVIGSYGKRSALDKSLNRDFSFKKHSWLAVKGHFKNTDFPKELVALHNFDGGYGGLSKTETGAVNFCYLTDYQSFKRYGDIEDFNKNVVAKNKYLSAFLKESEPIFEAPLSIAQISFEKKEPVVDHILMCGDTAGLIHPLCGNGMAMAIQSAKLACIQIRKFLNDENFDRPSMEKKYASAWNATFKKRLWFGRKLQLLLLNTKWVNTAFKASVMSQGLLKYVISKTHGKPIAND